MIFPVCGNQKPYMHFSLITTTIYDLPADFDTFSDLRQKAFLSVRDLQRTVPIVGCFCTFVPRELILAAGAAPISLCSGSDEAIPAGETDLPVNFCPLVKSSHGFTKTGKCPYYHFADLIVGETTCDGKNKMFEYMTKDETVHVIHLPQMINAASIAFLGGEFKKFAEKLEEAFSVQFTDAMIRQQIRAVNEERRALQEVYRLSMSFPPKLSGKELFTMFQSFSTSVGHEEKLSVLRALKEQSQSRPVSPWHPKRILLTGSRL